MQKKNHILLAVATFSTLFSSAVTSAESPRDKLAETQTKVAKSEGFDAEKADDSQEVDIKKVSQALGNFIGRNLKAPGITFDTESIIVGIREGSEGKPSPLSDEAYEQAMTTLQQKAVHVLADTNLQAADKFMKENKDAKGVVEIVPLKLQYQILTEGNGPVVPANGTPLINYTGKYSDGSVFGCSEGAGGPIAVPIDQTIPGFSKGIAGMKEGEKRRLFIHPEFGYGTSGQLPPNSLLIFDIEVVKATAPAKDLADQDMMMMEEDDIVITKEVAPVATDKKAADNKAADTKVSPTATKPAAK